jgi:poly(3-hydroxybutyrate) depolymerase
LIQNDIRFTSDILDKLENDYCVDKARIYSSGKSNGGGFTNTLACDPVLSKRIAAFAPVSGS